MPYIRVVYREKENYFDYVPANMLDNLINQDQIILFYRYSDKKCINVKLDPIRGSGGIYGGRERRGIKNNSGLQTQKIDLANQVYYYT